MFLKNFFYFVKDIVLGRQALVCISVCSSVQDGFLREPAGGASPVLFLPPI